jgi:hypothetical protein
MSSDLACYQANESVRHLARLKALSAGNDASRSEVPSWRQSIARRVRGHHRSWVALPHTQRENWDGKY